MGVRGRQSLSVQLNRDYSEAPYTRNNHLVKSSRRVAEILAKKQAKMGTNAVSSVDRRDFYFFRKKTFGRICSCAMGPESSPSKNCNICYGKGFVGGYDKYGTWTEVLDFTFGDIQMVNVEPAFDLNVVPTLMRLTPGAKKGVIRGTFRLRRNAGYCDAFAIVDSVQPGNNVVAMVRESGTTSWIEASNHNLTTLMHAEALDFEVTLTRKSNKGESPYFSHLMLRYGLLPYEQLLIPADIPRNTEGISLLDYGFDENFGSLSVFLDNRLQTVANDDMFFFPERNKWIEVTEVQPFQAVGTMLSMDVTCRFVQPYEAINRIPA